MYSHDYSNEALHLLPKQEIEFKYHQLVMILSYLLINNIEQIFLTIYSKEKNYEDTKQIIYYSIEILFTGYALIQQI
jgi:hypothetical protein